MPRTPHKGVSLKDIQFAETDFGAVKDVNEEDLTNEGYITAKDKAGNTIYIPYYVNLA